MGYPQQTVELTSWILANHRRAAIWPTPVLSSSRPGSTAEQAQLAAHLPEGQDHALCSLQVPPRCMHWKSTGQVPRDAQSHIPRWWLKLGILPDILASLFLPPTFSLSGNRLTPPWSPKSCLSARDSEQGDKKRTHGGGKKRPAKEHRRRTTFLGILPDSHPCVQIKGSGVRKEITHKCCFVVGQFMAGPQIPPDTWVLEWHLSRDFEVKTWNGLKDRLFEKAPYYPEGLFQQRSAEVLELASLVINARKRLMIYEGFLISVIHFFPYHILTFQTLSESLRREE